MALANVCGFEFQGGKSRLGSGLVEGFGGPSAAEALAASQSFTVPQGINVSLDFDVVKITLMTVHLLI